MEDNSAKPVIPQLKRMNTETAERKIAEVAEKRSLKFVHYNPSPISLFGAIVATKIMEEQKVRNSNKKLDDMMDVFPDLLPAWKDFINKFAGKSPITEIMKIEPSISFLSQHYDSLKTFFMNLVMEFQKMNFKGIEDRAFTDELILLAAFGIRYTNILIMEILNECIDATKIEEYIKAFGEHFSNLTTFHEFFFAMAKIQCNTILHERHLAVLEDSAKTTLKDLQLRLRNNFKLLVESPLQAKKLRIVATIIYHLIQTIAVLSVFGEAEELTVKKYQSILERFKVIFAMVSQSAVFDRIFCENFDFESIWTLNKSRYMLSSFGQTRLSIFLQDEKRSPEDIIEFSLKYVVVYYNYKILKLISHRLQVTYDEHMLNIFSTLIHKNRSILTELISQRDPQNDMRVMLYLNESKYIIKSYIVNLAYFSDNLDPIQRQAKYDTIKDTTVDCLSLIIKSEMYYTPETIEEVKEISIFDPKDFVALLFKTLLFHMNVKTSLKRNVRRARASDKYYVEMVRHINVLATDLVSRPITTNDPMCFYLYRLYFLQFLSQWNLEDLKEKYTKYSEEMSRYLADFGDGGLETEVLRELKRRNQDLALELYVKLAQIDSCLPISNTLGLIRESFTNEKKLNKYFYVMTCLICKQKVSSDEFKAIMQGDAEVSKEIMKNSNSCPEINAFIQKDGMEILFLIYKSTACSLMQTKEQRKGYEMEMGESLVRKSLVSDEVNNYVARNYLKKLDSTIEAYTNLIDITEAFICASNYNVTIAEEFLKHPEFNQDFYEKLLRMEFGRSLVLKLLRILEQHLVYELKNSDMINKYITIINDIFANLGLTLLDHTEERDFLLNIIGLLETLIIEIDETETNVGEIYFTRGIISRLLEVFQKKEYHNDIECFLRFLRLLRIVAKGNKLYYANNESQEYINTFILSAFDSFINESIISIQSIQMILKYLLDISLETDFDFNSTNQVLVICKLSTIELYFKILVKCFKKRLLESNESLCSHITYPLAVLENSFLNCFLLSTISAQELLMKILKYANDADVLMRISGFIGQISAVHTTAECLQLLLRRFIKESKHVPYEHKERYYETLLNTLINAITGDSIKNLYSFSGTEKSFIKLKVPLTNTVSGLFWTGNIRYESRDIRRKQCVFSFLDIAPNKTKGVELYISNRQLIYVLINVGKNNNTLTMNLSNIEIIENRWYHITMAHIGNELQVYVNTTQFITELDTHSFPREYNCATIGAATDPLTEEQTSFFFGEMSALYFFYPISKFKEITKNSEFRENFLHRIALLDNPLNEGLIKGQSKGLNSLCKELLASIHFALDPKSNIINKLPDDDVFNQKGRIMNVIDSIQETQLILNRPAKDVFYNLGGFKTVLPLLSSRLIFEPNHEEHNSKICCAILKLLRALCLIDDIEIARFLIKENGIEIVKYLFEKVGKFTSEFVKSLFQLLSLPAPPKSRLSKIIPLLIEKIVLNTRVWHNSDYSVQIMLMGLIYDLLLQPDPIAFSNGEPYNGILHMLFDYLAAEDDPSLKDFLTEIRQRLMQILISYLTVHGKEDAAPTIVDFLLPIPTNLYSIRNLLYSLLAYQENANKKSIITAYCKRQVKRKEFDMLTALPVLISTAVSQKISLAKLVSIEDAEVVNSKIKCYEDIIAYSVYILLTLNWEEILKKKNGSVESFIGQQSSKKSDVLNSLLDEMESFISYLDNIKGKGKLTTSEEIILQFLFHHLKVNSTNTEYDERFLGDKTYMALLSHSTSIPFTTYLKLNQPQLLTPKQDEWNTSRQKIIHGKIIENLRSFELIVQQRILIDYKILLSNKNFAEMFLSIENIYDSVCVYLSDNECLNEISIKESLEFFYLKFLAKFFQEKRVQVALNDMLNFVEAEFLNVLNMFLDLILHNVSEFSTSNSIYSAIQLVYFLEDATINNSAILTLSLFVKVLAKLILYLNEIDMLYFWDPLYSPGNIPKTQHFTHEEYNQREGGIVRVIIKLIFSVIAREAKAELDETHGKLILKLLGFYIFRKRKILERIKHLLNLTISTTNNEPITSLKSLLFSSTSLLRQKLIIYDKSVTYQKNVEEIKNIKGFKSTQLNSPYYRLILLYINLTQVLIYTIYNVRSYRKLEVQNISLSYNMKYLTKILGRLVNLCCDSNTSEFKKFLEEFAGDFSKLSEYSLDKCITNIDGYSRKEIETARSCIEEHTSSFKHYPQISLDTKPSTSSYDIEDFVTSTVDTFVNLRQLFEQYKKKELVEELYIGKIAQIITLESSLSVQSGLHKLISEDLLQVEHAILMCIENKPKVSQKIPAIKNQNEVDTKRIIKMHSYAQVISKTLSKLDIEHNSDSSSDNKRDYENLCKRVLSDFAIKNKENRELYGIASKYYKRILNRCELHKLLKVPDTPNAFQSFATLDLARDNLGRAMRFKEIKQPLNNPSVLKGIAYVRHFFLKRALIESVASCDEKEMCLANSFLIPDKYQHKLIKTLMAICKPLGRLLANKSFETPGNKKSKRENAFAIKSCVTRTQLASECGVKIQQVVKFKADIIRVDHSIFGVLKLLDNEIVFSSKPKEDSPEYRTGPPSQMGQFYKKTKKIWYHKDIKEIIGRNYNMIKQAVEIRFISNKSVFLVLFARSQVKAFFNQLANTGIRLIIDYNKEFAIRKYTEKWQNMKLTNFEYLMLINDYANRCFQCMSQYPIFPWLLLGFSNENMKLSTIELRNLKDTISGITPKKKELGEVKYSNTDDFPGGQFQFGTHYLPGRGVLGYLMRIQPYTLMIYRFDSGGDCPSRCFHSISTMWNNIEIQVDNNLELIPEFYYLPEFLANQYGYDEYDDNDERLKWKMVRVDKVVLPSWAKGKYHYILMNYLALEHPRVRSKINNWIDLIFGDKQQNSEYYNLFKPLTYEKYVEKREKSKDDKLDISDITQIVEFGQIPSQVFEKSHPSIDERSLENPQSLFDVLYNTQTYTATQYKQKETKSCDIRIMAKDRQNLLVINSKNELMKRSLTSTKNSYKIVEQYDSLLPYFNIYNSTKKTFSADPTSIFILCENFIITCRNKEDHFIIYNPSIAESTLAISFHKTIVNALHYNERLKELYSGDFDGVLAVWNFDKNFQSNTKNKRPKYFYVDHYDAIVTIDSNYELDLYVSASKSSCVLRIASTNRYFLTIVPKLALKVNYRVFKVLLSARGYLIIQGRSELKMYEGDMIAVYSINGELVVQRELDEFINAIILDSHQYFIITGGTAKKLKRYSIITLEEEDLNQSIERTPEFPATIITLTLIPGDKPALMVGLSESQVYLIEFSTAKIEPKQL